MGKSSKLIVAAIGLGGLGYFLYKKGLFANVLPAKEVVNSTIDTSKKTTVEPLDDVIPIVKITPTEPVVTQPINNPIQQPVLTYPKDEWYPPLKEEPIYIPSYNNPYLYDNLGFRDNTYFDQPIKIDYSTGKYNQDVEFDYMDRDITNIRLNQSLYA